MWPLGVPEKGVSRYRWLTQRKKDGLKGCLRESTVRRKAGSTPRFRGVAGEWSLICFLNQKPPLHIGIGQVLWILEEVLFRQLDKENSESLLSFSVLPNLQFFSAKSSFVVTPCFYSHCFHRVFKKRM